MDLKTFLKSLGDEEARATFAAACSTTLGHMRNTIYVPGKLLAPEACVLAERASGRQVMRWDLRPEDWHRIWPELIGTEGAPAVTEPAAQA
jgi:DNA-binding transcriptional regulator YdaS (Cro superfamily)